jgi:amino acid transporter
MSRDNRLPGSAALSKVHPKLHTPIFSCIVIAILAAIPLFKYAGAGIIAIAATGMIYLAYFLGNLAVLRARLKGWPREKTPFSLGKWGIPVNVLALLWGGSMLVNFAWPRVDSNPTPNQTAGALSTGISELNKVPILYTVLGVILLVGVLYYFISEVRKPKVEIIRPPETGPLVIPVESLPPDEINA